MKRDLDYDLFRRDWWLGRVDGRPLALFRMAFAAILLKDATYHLWLARAFYSDAGVVPRSALTALLPVEERLTPMRFLGEPWQAQLVFALWAVVLVALLLGWRTRTATVLNFLFVLAIHERDVWVLNGGDTVIRVLSFWSLFVPLGAVWSLDARRRRRRSPAGYDGSAFALPVRALQLQVALIYVFTFAIKLGGEPWRDGSALARTLGLRSFAQPLGDWVAAHGGSPLLHVLTYATLVVEGGFLLLVFCPFLQPWLRAVGLLGGVGLHLGIGVLMAIDNFSIVMLASYCLLLDRRWLDAVERWLSARQWRRGPPRAEPLRPAPQRLGVGEALTALVVVPALALVVWWNLDTVRWTRSTLVGPLPRIVTAPVRTLGLWQEWNMFSPRPISADGWITVPARYENGRALDLLTGKPEAGRIHRYLVGPSMRWRKYTSNLARLRSAVLLRDLAASWCRGENRGVPRGRRLSTLEIRWWWRPVGADGRPVGRYLPVVLWRHWCQPKRVPRLVRARGRVSRRLRA